MKNKNVFIVSLVLLGLYIYFVTNNNPIAIENITIPAISIIDTKTISDELYYIIDTMTYDYKQNSSIKHVKPSVDSITPGEARHKYNLLSKGNLLPGMQKVLLLGSSVCETGLDTFITMFFASRTYSDTSQCAVISIPGKSLLETTLPGNDDIADFIEGLLKNAHYDNFFSDKFKIMDIYFSLANEGHNLALPHIKIENSEPTIDGMAIFKKDKLFKLLDLNDSKTMNLLRESSVSGNIYLKETNDKMADCFVKSKRKVQCKKIDDKYYFTIKLSLKGEIFGNTLYENISENQDSINAFKGRIEYKLTQKCNNFIDQMQNNYKIDCLNLGSYIIAKEGINKGIDCDELVSNSEIKVVVDLVIDTFGRGDF